MIKVKICGITNYDDALLVTNLGAEFIGFNFWKESPRRISPALAKEIIAKLPPFITSVGVFVNEESAEIVKRVKKCGLKMLQLHGDETPDFCQALKNTTGLPVIKAFRMRDEGVLSSMAAYSGSVDYFLLDAYVPDEPGGTGAVFNWDLAVKAKDWGKPIFLAGGLTPENVYEAAEKVMPFAVDVASGVERLERRKDYNKMNLFIRRARGLQ